MREVAQVVSYEIPLAPCVVVPVLIAGTMDLVEIGQPSGGLDLPLAAFFAPPFTFMTFCVYGTCAVASTNRAPFDLPEAESELVAGFLTEYSGFRWVIFFMAEYAAMFVVSGLAAILFLGGWNGPIPIAPWLGLTPENGAILGWIGNLFGMCNFIAKAVFGVTCMIWARWTLPRLRIDQVMTTCLKYCVPLASAMMAGAMLWCYFLPDGVTATLQASGPSLWEATPVPIGTMRQHPARCMATGVRLGLQRANPGEWMTTDPINWHSVFFLLTRCEPARSPWRWSRPTNRAHGVLSGRVAGGGGGIVLSGGAHFLARSS